MNDITVCICAYNAEHYLEQTLNSLERQNIDFYWIIVNDCSSDATQEVIDRFMNHTQKNASNYRFEKNMGTAYSRNWCLHHTQTKYMMFFDADDIAKPTLVSRLYEKINSDERIIAVSCYSEYIDSNGRLLGGGQRLGPVTEEEFLEKADNGKIIFMMPVTLFRRDKAIQAGGYRLDGFPEGEIRYQDLSEDLDIWSRMSDSYKDGFLMLTIPEVLYSYRKADASLSTGYEKQLAMTFKMAYIKNNLKLRRRGQKDLTYIQYTESLLSSDKRKIVREFRASYHYRNGAFAFVRRRYISAACQLVWSFLTFPGFVVRKLRSLL